MSLSETQRIQEIQLLTELEGASGDGTSLLTFYVPFDMQMAKATALLQREAPTAARIQSRV